MISTRLRAGLLRLPSMLEPLRLLTLGVAASAQLGSVPTAGSLLSPGVRYYQASSHRQEQRDVEGNFKGGPALDPGDYRDEPHHNAEHREELRRGGRTLAPSWRPPCQDKCDDHSGHDRQLRCSSGWTAVAAYQHIEVD
jgi:hypothetical protein